MCQQLSDGKLNPESLKRGYVLLRNAANKWVNLPQIQKLVKDLKQPTENWYHLMFAHVCGFMIDNLIAVCSMLEEDWVYKILFSDEKDKHFFSCGVEHGHFIRAGADQFLEFSRAYKVSDFEAAIKCESSHMKLLENLLVKFVHLREEVEKRERLTTCFMKECQLFVSAFVTLSKLFKTMKESRTPIDSSPVTCSSDKNHP